MKRERRMQARVDGRVARMMDRGMSRKTDGQAWTRGRKGVSHWSKPRGDYARR